MDAASNRNCDACSILVDGLFVVFMFQSYTEDCIGKLSFVHFINKQRK